MIPVNNLKEYRQKEKLSQIYVADYLGITQSTYSYHESGKSFLNAKQIFMLCDLYKCSPNDLLGFRGVHETTASIDE